MTLIVPLALADAPSRLVIEGGTHASATAGKWLTARKRRRLSQGLSFRTSRFCRWRLPGGGVFTRVEINEHTRTAAEIIASFTSRTTQFEQDGEGRQLVRCT